MTAKRTPARPVKPAKRPPRKKPAAAAATALEGILEHRFHDPELLALALTHTSYANEHGVPHNQRLEFLGDAVLGLVAGRFLYDDFPGASEGELSKLRASLVNEKALAALARTWGLGAALRLGASEIRTQGHEKESLLADAVEAVMGAVYLDGGIEAAEAVMLRFFDPAVLFDAARGDPKSRLQEWAQKNTPGLPVYSVAAEKGPEHAKWYRVSVTLDGHVLGHGEGTSKKQAEAAAALAALQELERA